MNPNYGVIIVVVVIVEIMQENAPEKLISEVKKQVCFEVFHLLQDKCINLF